MSVQFMKSVENISKVIFDEYLVNNYTFALDIKDANIQEAKKILKELSFKETLYEIDIDKYLAVFKGSSTTKSPMITLRYYGSKEKGDITVYGYIENCARTPLVYQKLFDNAFKKYRKVADDNRAIVEFTSFSVGFGDQILDETTYIEEEDFKDIDPDYYPFLDMEVLVQEFLQRKESLLVLSGDTGTGKTKFASNILKICMNNYNLVKQARVKEDFININGLEYDENVIRVGYLKNEDILAMDSFWTLLKNEPFDFIILDDLDYMLLPRKREVTSDLDVKRSKFVSQLLSYTDGIIPVSTKFITTSNKGVKEVDSALLRSGRLFDILTFRALTYKESLKIFQKYIDKKNARKLFEEEFGIEPDKDLPMIKQSDLGSYIYAVQHGGGKRKYIKENSISIADESRYQSDKKIGFK